MIKSSQNPKIKLARALFGRPKERQEARAFIAEGVRLVEEAAAADWPIQALLYDSGISARGQEIIRAQKTRGVDVEEVSAALLQSLSETETSQGILAILSLAELPIAQSPDFILIPDQIRDPGNLGTLLRSAAAAGAQAALLPPETTDAFAPKVVRAGMGAHFHLPIRQMSWEQIEQLSKSGNVQILLADTDGRSVWEMDLRKPLALIIGGEAEGASGQARKLASEHISIPMARGAESLNAAMAGSILMFEVLRQRSNITTL